MPQVFLLAAVFGCGLGAFAAVDWALAVNLLPRGNTAAKFMAIWHTCMTVPQILSPVFGPVGDALNARYGHGFGWRAAMLSSVIYLVIGTALLHRIRERPVDAGAIHPAVA
jgi:MFS family permease